MVRKTSPVQNSDGRYVQCMHADGSQSIPYRIFWEAPVFPHSKIGVPQPTPVFSILFLAEKFKSRSLPRGSTLVWAVDSPILPSMLCYVRTYLVSVVLYSYVLQYVYLLQYTCVSQYHRGFYQSMQYYCRYWVNLPAQFCVLYCLACLTNFLQKQVLNPIWFESTESAVARIEAINSIEELHRYLHRTVLCYATSKFSLRLLEVLSALMLQKQIISN